MPLSMGIREACEHEMPLWVTARLPTSEFIEASVSESARMRRVGSPNSTMHRRLLVLESSARLSGDVHHRKVPGGARIVSPRVKVCTMTIACPQ